MKKNKKNSGLSPLALIIIITTSIVAAAGIVLLVLKLIHKKNAAKAVKECDCCDGLDPWDFGDDDILGELSFDDDEDIEGECCECDCEGCCECEDKVPEEISAAVDEAIDAISAVTDSLDDDQN